LKCFTSFPNIFSKAKTPCSANIRLTLKTFEGQTSKIILATKINNFLNLQPDGEPLEVADIEAFWQGQLDVHTAVKGSFKDGSLITVIFEEFALEGIGQNASFFIGGFRGTDPEESICSQWYKTFWLHN